MEQISSKYFLPYFSSNGSFLVLYKPRSSGPQDIHHILSFFWLNCYRFFYKFAVLWACDQLALKYVKESESTLQISLSETNEPKENETWRLKIEFSYWHFPKEEAAYSVLFRISWLTLEGDIFSLLFWYRSKIRTQYSFVDWKIWLIGCGKEGALVSSSWDIGCWSNIWTATRYLGTYWLQSGHHTLPLKRANLRREDYKWGFSNVI